MGRDFMQDTTPTVVPGTPQAQPVRTSSGSQKLAEAIEALPRQTFDQLRDRRRWCGRVDLLPTRPHQLDHLGQRNPGVVLAQSLNDDLKPLFAQPTRPV